MTETQITLAAKAIRKTLERTKGAATPWALARAALLAAGVSHETDPSVSRGSADPASVFEERIKKSMAKTKRYMEASRRGWETRKRQAAARARAEAEAKTGERAA